MIEKEVWKEYIKPTDIKYIVISHAHFDHMNSVAELVGLTGAK